MPSPGLKNAAKSFIMAGASATDTTTKIRLACAKIKIKSDPGLWESTNGDGLGFFSQTRGVQKCTGSFNIYHRVNDAQTPVSSGFEYFVWLYEDGNALPYRGTVIIGVKETVASETGELVTSVDFAFQGVYDSPGYPTAIADAAAGTGQFAPNFVPSAAPASGGANGTAKTGGVTNVGSAPTS